MSTTTSAASTTIPLVITSAIATSTQATTTISNNNNVKLVVANFFSDEPLLSHIAACESRDRQFEPDGTVFRGIVNSKDVGVMQINEKYHLKRATTLGIDIYTLEGNLAYAKLLFDEQGSQPWISSSPCWGKYVGQNSTLAMK